jgi:TctA family transporter
MQNKYKVYILCIFNILCILYIFYILKEFIHLSRFEDAMHVGITPVQLKWRQVQ